MGLINRAPMAQVVEHRVVTREVVSSTPAGPTLRVFKYLRNKCYLCNLSTWNVKEPPHHSKRVRREVPGVVAVRLSSKCGRFGRDVLKRLAVYNATYAKTAIKRNFAEC